MFKPILGTAAIVSLVATPVMAAAAPASANVQSVERSAASTDGESSLAAPGAFVALALFAAVIAGGIILAVSNDDDEPVSP